MSSIVLMVSLHNNQAEAYEYSIYPYLTRGEYLALGSIILILILTMHISGSVPITKRIKTSFMAMTLITGIIMYSLPVLRGYFMWNGRGDPSSHYAYAKFILDTGHIWVGSHGYMYYRSDYYPLLHILHATLSMVSGISLLRLANWIPSYFWIFYFILMYIILTRFVDNKGAVFSLFVGFFLLIPIHKWYLNLTPNATYNLLLFPLTLYLAFKGKENIKHFLMLSILMSVAILWHPLAFIVDILVIASFYVLPSVFKSHKDRQIKNAIYLVIIVTMVFSIWLVTFWPGVLFIKSISKLLAGESVYAPAIHLKNTIKLVSSYKYNPWLLFILMWGLQISVIGISSIVLFKNWISRIMKKQGVSLSPIGMFFILVLLYMGVLFILPFGASPLRLVYYALIAGTIYLIVDNRNIIANVIESKHGRMILSTMLLLAFLWGFITLYPSPIVVTPNLQTTGGELIGIQWFIENFNDTYTILGTYNLPIGRYAQVLLTPSEISSLGRPFTKWYMPLSNQVAPHFGYLNHSSMCLKDITGPCYIILTSYDIQKYTKVLPNLQRAWYYPWDFERLYSDQRVNRVYVSTDIQIFTTKCGVKMG